MVQFSQLGMYSMGDPSHYNGATIMGCGLEGTDALKWGPIYVEPYKDKNNMKSKSRYSLFLTY